MVEFLDTVSVSCFNLGLDAWGRSVHLIDRLDPDAPVVTVSQPPGAEWVATKLFEKILLFLAEIRTAAPPRLTLSWKSSKIPWRTWLDGDSADAPEFPSASGMAHLAH